MTTTEQTSATKQPADASKTEFAVPPSIKWSLMLLSLIFLPYKANLLTYLISADLTYGEVRLVGPDKIFIFAKNSGTSSVTMLTKSILMHVCERLDGKEGFVPLQLDTISPASYSFVVIPRDKAQELPNRVRFNEVEVAASQLRVTTPIDETQYLIAAAALLLLSAALTHEMTRWWVEDAAAVTARN